MGLTFRRYLDEDCEYQKIIVYSSLKPYSQINQFNEEKLNINFDEKYFSRKGDILMKTIAPNTAVCVVDEEGYVVGDKIVIIRLHKNYDCNFIATLLNSMFVKKQLHKYMSSSSVKHVSLDNIKNLNLILPDIDQQREYSEIFTLIDEKIITTQKILKSTKNLKDGLINDLLGLK